MKGSPLAGARGLELYAAGGYKAVSIGGEKTKLSCKVMGMKWHLRVPVWII